nr:hypothetical protein [uncultured archaeon]
MASSKELIEKIKEKKELSGIDSTLIKEILESYLKKYKISPSNLAKKEEKVIIKEIRAKLRDNVGQYQTSAKNRIKLLEQNKLDELLKTHSSTSERLDFYPQLRKIIETLKPNSILDLGCGLNPLALASKKINYFASDINNSDLIIVKIFFEKNNLQGKTFVYNLRNPSKNLPTADLCLLLKTIDTLGEKNHNLTAHLLEKINCRYFLISFSTKLISGKKMNQPRRVWFESLLKRKSLKYKTFKSSNEIFYLIKNQ